MAKKKENKKPDADGEWITCEGVNLEINADLGFLKLTVFPGQLHLDDMVGDPSPILKLALKAIADRYPATDWQFQVDDEENITAVRNKPAKS